MKRFIICILLSIPSIVFSQYKIAVVSATTGQTKICPTLDSAYNSAAAGDYIYLPAGSFTLTNPIAKSIKIYGTGINPDSSLNGITMVSSLVLIAGSDFTRIEGIKIFGVAFGYGNSSDNTSAKVSNITFQRCEISQIILNTDQSLLENRPKDISFNENKLGLVVPGLVQNWTFSKNIISGMVSDFSNSTFINNCFFCGSGPGSPCLNVSNSSFYNNIWYSASSIYYTYGNMNNNEFHNSINCVANTTSNLVVTNFTMNPTEIFINPNNGEWYKNNYHLQPTCPGVNAGSDGTDLGIYGSSQPTKFGWIPSNPHVYYKNVAGQNNSSGILNGTFKVKAQSN